MSHSFESLGLQPELVQAVQELGYEEPTAIQAQAIPALLAGRDILGQSQTGTGKTAAFALPMLQQLDTTSNQIQGLVLVPTRELAIQISNAAHQYGRHRTVRVLPIYGGQPYTRQIKRLEQGVHILVGTPGRTLDLIQQGALDLSTVRYLVLDEADEMLKMGFIDDVEAIVGQTPETRQMTLFSATIPAPVRRLTSRYMRDPLTVAIEKATMTVAQTEQRYYLLDADSKVAALARLLEVEDISSMLIFAQTRAGTVDLTEALLGRGYAAEAIHGDLSQTARETVLRRFRQGQVKVLVATNVMARGLDINDVSHVVNFDVPDDVEEYVHRIGRTGRAGRPGVAITLATPRERRRLKAIEAFTNQPVTRSTLPPPAEVLRRRDERFKAELSSHLGQDDLSRELALLAELTESGCDVAEVAAAAIRLARAPEEQRPIDEVHEVSERRDRTLQSRARGTARAPTRSGHDRPAISAADRPARRPTRPRANGNGREQGMVRLALDLGRAHGIQPGDVVGAIANEAGIPGQGIGAIDIYKHHTFVDVQATHVDHVLRQMSSSTLRGQAMKLTLAD